MDFKSKLNFYIDSVNSELSRLSEVPENLQKSVYEAMRYSLMAGGKRLRPVLVLSVCEMLGGCMEDAMRFAAAIECIHTYSLIHDDLPCMDDDDLRRGNPTCHKRFGESTALLAGDGLLTYAFEHMSDFGKYKEAKAEDVLRTILEIAKGVGADGMIGGQVVDLLNEGKSDVSENALSYMHERKTGALIRVSALAGAASGGASEEETAHIRAFAELIGLAFQIKDDILDCTGNEEILGKPIGSDRENGKTTYVSVFGLEGAKKRLCEVTERAVKELEIFGERAEFLKALAGYLTKREN